MKIGIYSPYLDTFGGGEKYMMTIAEVLSNDFDVEVLLDKHLQDFGANYLKQQLSERFDLNLNKANFVKGPLGAGSNIIYRCLFLKRYDILFYLTDGSIFYSTAKHSILHIQSPLAGQPAKSFWGKIKLKGWALIIYNSEFTKHNSESNWPLLSQVIYPPVDTTKIKPLKKKNYILSVGRFFGYLKGKKHDILIQTFKDLRKERLLSGWSLHLAGSVSAGDRGYLKELKGLAKGFPVSFYPNLDYDALIKLYGESSIYWHAAGFGETDPTKMEHFGITTVEAMAAGCVPVVIQLGGQTEIVQNGENGFLWNSLSDLEKFTTLLVKNHNLKSGLSKKAILASHKFSKIRFEKEILTLLNKL